MGCIMENAEGIKGFEQWERYVRENEAYLAGQEQRHNTVYVNDVNVLQYPYQRIPNAGIWLQDSRKHIIIYASGEAGEVVFHRDFQKDTETGPVHMHSNIEIGFVVRGCARQSFNGKEYRFRAGDFWITNPNCYHCDIYHLEELFTVYFSISLETFDSAILGFVENSEIQQFLRTSLMRQKMIRQFLHFTRKSNGGIEAQRILNQILQEIIEKKTGYEDVVKGLTKRLVEELSVSYDFLVEMEEKRRLRDLLYQEVEQYLQKHYHDANIDNLVQEFHYNEDYYNRLIREYSGQTYSERLKTIRLQKAEELLQDSERSIEEIIVRVGYQSRSYFYDMFRKEYGITPAQYRKRMQAEKEGDE